jgi:hypothetical protein
MKKTRIFELDLEAQITINGVPLYPKKEWVGLNYGEIVGLTCECIDDGTFNMDCAFDFAKRIEEELKYLNGK